MFKGGSNGVVRSDNESKLVLSPPNKGEDRKLPKRIEFVSNDEEILVMGNGGGGKDDDNEDNEDNEDNGGVVVVVVVVVAAVRVWVGAGVVAVAVGVDDDKEIS